MIHTITIEIHKDNDLTLIKELAEKMGLSTLEDSLPPKTHHDDLNALLNRVAGSWKGEETGDELTRIIKDPKFRSRREIEL